MSQRIGRDDAIKFEIGAKREPIFDRSAMRPKIWFRSGKPFAR
jgi:hypothetical protein